MTGVNLSAHSGVGHVNPHMEEIMEVGLSKMIIKFNSEANKVRRILNNYNLYMATTFTLIGMEKYFQNYAKLALDLTKNYPN